MLDSTLPLITVCIPVYNGENYLSNCIKSILDQDYDNFEVLIMDNCSTDSTASIVFSFEDNRIRYIKNNVNIGALMNMSKGVDNAKGEYFVLLPHDDMLLPGCLKEFSSKLIDPTIGIVYAAVVVVDKHGKAITTRTDHSSNKLFTHQESLINLVDNFMPIQLAMVRTSILTKLGGFSTEFSLFSDCHLWFRVALEGWKSYYFTRPFSSFRSHDKQGQHAVLNQDLDILSDHVGKKLEKGFWKNNNYNYLFLKLSGWLLDEMLYKKYNVMIINHVKKSLLKELLSGHMISILRSLIKRSKFMFLQEIKLLKPLIVSFGFFKVFSSYLSVFIFLVKKKIIN
jgi:glycosyltransferase involved in cell wall biosynthesis